MTTVTATDPVPLADDELAELTAEIRSYVERYRTLSPARQSALARSCGRR